MFLYDISVNNGKKVNLFDKYFGIVYIESKVPQDDPVFNHSNSTQRY